MKERGKRKKKKTTWQCTNKISRRRVRRLKSMNKIGKVKTGVEQRKRLMAQNG